MGIVSLSLLALATVGTFHLFNIVSWVERLQDRLINAYHHPLPHHHPVKGFINVGRSCLEATSKKVFVTLSRRFLLRSIPAQSYHQVSRVEHFSALRFFPISRGTMKGMAATAVTYLIILIQFKSGTPVTPS